MSPSRATFLVECFWPGVSEAKLAAAAERSAHDRSAVCDELILVPADEIVLCLFRAASATAIRDASRRAGLPSERIVEAIRISPGAARAAPTRSARLPPGAWRRPRGADERT